MASLLSAPGSVFYRGSSPEDKELLAKAQGKLIESVGDFATLHKLYW